MIAPTVTPTGLYVAASVIVAICDRSPHSAPQPGHQLGRLLGDKATSFPLLFRHTGSATIGHRWRGCGRSSKRCTQDAQCTRWKPAAEATTFQQTVKTRV